MSDFEVLDGAQVEVPPHPYASILAPDKDALRSELEQIAERFEEHWQDEHGGSRPFVYDDLLVIVIAGCGTWRAHSLDDLPLFSVPCECGKGYFIKYERDDAEAWDWTPAPTKGRELVRTSG